jgi:uncharacterized membrane protein YkvA (DUF1232 family)
MGLIGLLTRSPKQVMKVPGLVRDARVPRRLKIIALVAALFIISPLNILGDIPLLGLLDDAALLGLLLDWFVRSAERYGVDTATATQVGRSFIVR